MGGLPGAQGKAKSKQGQCQWTGLLERLGRGFEPTGASQPWRGGEGAGFSLLEQSTSSEGAGLSLQERTTSDDRLV